MANNYHESSGHYDTGSVCEVPRSQLVSDQRSIPHVYSSDKIQRDDFFNKQTLLLTALAFFTLC